MASESYHSLGKVHTIFHTESIQKIRRWSEFLRLPPSLAAQPGPVQVNQPPRLPYR